MFNIADYYKLQPSFVEYLQTATINNRVSHAYMLETDNLNFGFDMAIVMSKFLLCNRQGCDECHICQQIDNRSFPDLLVIDDEKATIKKEEIINLKTLFSRKTVGDNYQIYIIKDASLLNASSANSLLKFLEEPNTNIIAILITNNRYKVIDTIVSRCQLLKLKSNITTENKIITVIDNSSFLGLNDDKQKIKLQNIIDEINYVDTYRNKALTYMALYDEDFELFLSLSKLTYLDALHQKNDIDDIYFNTNVDFITKIAENNTQEAIIEKLELIDRFINEMKYQPIKSLIVDKYIVLFSKIGSE